MEIFYVTGNSAKFEEACLILDVEQLKSHGIYIQRHAMDLEEIQGTQQQIARHKVKEATRKLDAPCMIDDVSLSAKCLGGLPGPYIRSFLEALGDGGLAELVSHYSDRSCSITCTIGYGAPDTEPEFFAGTIEAEIVAPRGTRKHKTSWNAIIEPQGFTKTYAEMSLEEMSRFSPRSLALAKFRNYLLSEYP